jgi:hypothetical protein
MAESKGRLEEVFAKTEYIIFRVFIILSLLFGVSVLLVVEWGRLRDLARLLGFR